jgi:hypothetical protein
MAVDESKPKIVCYIFASSPSPKIQKRRICVEIKELARNEHVSLAGLSTGTQMLQ